MDKKDDGKKSKMERKRQEGGSFSRLHRLVPNGAAHQGWRPGALDVEAAEVPLRLEDLALRCPGQSTAERWRVSGHSGGGVTLEEGRGNSKAI